MKILRIALHGLVLTAINLVSIIVAYGIYYALRPANQILIQASAAGLLSVAAFWIGSALTRRPRLAPIALQGATELAGTYLAALIWAPALFIPIHYVTQGYLTSFSNITATWLFQLPVNLVAILLAARPASARRPAAIN